MRPTGWQTAKWGGQKPWSEREEYGNEIQSEHRGKIRVPRHGLGRDIGREKSLEGNNQDVSEHWKSALNFQLVYLLLY